MVLDALVIKRFVKKKEKKELVQFGEDLFCNREIRKVNLKLTSSSDMSETNKRELIGIILKNTSKCGQ